MALLATFAAGLTLPRPPRQQRPAVRCAAQNPGPAPSKLKASAIPTPDEDREVAHTAYLDAFTAAQPESVRIRGMQEFASAILARARIPSQAYTDPLAHIFQVRSTSPPRPAPLAEILLRLHTLGHSVAQGQKLSRRTYTLRRTVLHCRSLMWTRTGA